MLGAILAAGSLILQGASALAGNSAQAKQAKANATAAKDAFSETSRALAKRQEEEALASAQQVYDVTQGGVAQRGSIASSAASAGVAGASVDALDAETLRNEYNARDIIDRNLAMTDEQIALQRSSALSEMKSRINSVQGPSNLATGLQIGGALTAFGYDWLKLRPKE